MLSHYVEELTRVLKHLDLTAVERIAQAILVAWQSERTVFCCGNGGSAASACHFIADLRKLPTMPGGRPVRALALTESMSAISAIANDVAYEEIFAEQMRGFLKRNDVVIGFSTSGSSPNVLRAIEAANQAGAVTLGITGREGVALRALSQHSLTVDSVSVQHVEDATMIAGHVVCLRVKELIARASEVLVEERRVLKAVMVPAMTTACDGLAAPPRRRAGGNGGAVAQARRTTA